MTHLDQATTPTGLSRRHAIGLLVTAGVLPAVVGVVAGPPAAAAPGSLVLDAPLRGLDRPHLAFERLHRLTSRRHRLTFYRATWDSADGAEASAIVHDLEVKDGTSWVTIAGEAERFDEQWVVIEGDPGFLIGGNYYPSGTPHWLAAQDLTTIGSTHVELTASIAGVLDMQIRWSLSDSGPLAEWSLTVHRDGGFVVGYQAGSRHAEDEVSEVLCGSQQHARVFGEPTAKLAWELFAPMALIEHTAGQATVTTGVHVPAGVLEFEHERFLGGGDQPFGMSLRNDARDVQASIYAPPGGARSALAAGQSIGYAFGVVAEIGPLYDAQVRISRTEYGFERYRENVYDTSMTGTVHNIIDLVSIEPDGDDSVDFIPSVSGWWDRGKGFANIEGDQQVRTAVASVLLSANLLASPPDRARSFWDRRARPLIEHIFSRRDIGYSPKAGFANHHVICGTVGDANTLVPVWQLMRGQSAGLHALALESVRAAAPFQGRTPMNRPLSAYLLTGDEGWLAQAVEVARWYARHQIHTPYTTNFGTSSFGYTLVKAWIELFVLYELTGHEDLLEAAHIEAKRYMGLFEVRPIGNGKITSPVGEPIDDMYYQWEVSAGIPDYPRDIPVTERVDAWEVSTTGLTFEQLSTFLKTPGGGFTLNPIWAPFLIRLAEAVGDDFIRDMAHSMVVGRFTNYPGYYNRQFITAPGRPEYPIEGPPGTSSIYFHHAPAQLGLAIDYLLSEHETKSHGAIRFPSAFECVFVYFRYRTYGHEPGTFFGDEQVWPYFPPGIVTVDNTQLNWLTATSESDFYVSVANVSGSTQAATITFDPELTGVEPTRRYTAQLIDADGHRRNRPVSRGAVHVSVPAHGLVAVKVPGAGRLQRWHVQADTADRSGVSYHLDDIDGSGNSTTDRVRGIALPRPDRSGYDVYVQCSAAPSAEVGLEHRTGSGEWTTATHKPHPYEWTIAVEDLAETFTYRVTINGVARPDRTLRLPSTVTGSLPAGQTVGGDLLVQPSVFQADAFSVTARVHNTSGAPITGASVIAYAPTGWALATETPLPAVVNDGKVAEATFLVTAPTGAGARDYPITGRVVFDGGNVVLTPGRVQVFAATEVIECLAAERDLAAPGSSTQISLTVMNRSLSTRTGTATLVLPSGWAAEPQTQEWAAPGRELVDLTFTVTATEAAPGSGGTITVDPGDGLPATNIPMKVGNPNDVVVSPTDVGYSEIGNWLASSLAGPDGSKSRYSPEGVYGGQARWEIDVVTSGVYDVSVWYPSNSQTSEDVLYEVVTSAGTEEHHVNQQEQVGQWRPLGSYHLTEGETANVTLTVISGLYTRAHSARFTLQGSGAPPTAVVTTPPVHADAATAAPMTVAVTASTSLDAVAARVELREGWQVEPAEIAITLAPAERAEITFTVTPPPGVVVGTLTEGRVVVGEAVGAFAAEVGEVASSRVVVDNHSSGYSEAGAWSSSSLPGHDGRATRWGHGSAPTRTAAWETALPAAGRYLVEVWYPAHTNSTRSATYEVITATNEAVRTPVDETVDGSMWRPLGCYDLSAVAIARILCEQAGHHRLNAVRFSPVQALA